MLRSVIADEGFCDHLLACFDALVTKSGQRHGVSLAAQNRIDDCQSGQSRDVTDDVMQLQIHLVQCLLHVVDVRGCHLHEAFAVAQQRTNRTYFLIRPV
jgi:hypothetical protein